jgi:hypothetical protein
VLKTTTHLISGPELEREAKEAIQRILATIPGARIESVNQPSHGRWDFEVHFVTSTGSKTLICEARSRAWPNELHAIAHRLEAAPHSGASRQTVPVLIAPYVSKQAAETCLDLGLSWADLAGNCELRMDGAFIKIQGEPNSFRKGRGTASLYTPKSANVVHALLLDRHRAWTTEDLARAANVSLGQVAGVKKLLEANNWIRASYGKTELIEPAKLLEDWSLHFKPKRKPHRLYTLDSPSQFESKVASTLPDYAFTEFSAAQRYAPYTRYQRVAFYVPRWDAELSRTLGLNEGDGASNVTVYEQSEPLLFVETLADVRCASPVQTYLDLKAVAGRGQDAASHLLESVIQPRWK